MKGLLITFAAILALSNSAPQGVEFSAKEYQALQSALGDRIPVAIQSAIRILAGSESNPTDFVVLNFPGLGGQVARVGGAAGAGNVPVARTGSVPADDDVAETFSEVAEDAVEDVREAADNRAEEVETEAEAETEVEAEVEAEVEEDADVNRTGIAAAETTAAAAAEAKEAEITVAAAVEAEPATAEAPRGKRQQMLEAFRRKRQQMEAARIKRQQEEQRTRYATELSFGLSALGNLYARRN